MSNVIEERVLINKSVSFVFWKAILWFPWSLPSLISFTARPVSSFFLYLHILLLLPEQKIDGPKLLALTHEELMSLTNHKLGPALKLKSFISSLKQQSQQHNMRKWSRKDWFDSTKKREEKRREWRVITNNNVDADNYSLYPTFVMPVLLSINRQHDQNKMMDKWKIIYKIMYMTTSSPDHDASIR